MRWRRHVFDAIHGLSHPGSKASQRLVAAKFVWHGLKKDIRDWANTCLECQRAKVHRHTKAPLELFPVPERRFDHANVDLVGPLPSSHGLTYLLTMVDRTTRWPEARFGTPSDISSDQGTQFTSELGNAVAQSLGVKLHHTTAYHPQAKRLCERFHRSIKAVLHTSLRDSSWVLLNIRTARKEDLQSSSAVLVYGLPAAEGSRGLGPWHHRSFVCHSPAVHAIGQCKAFCTSPHSPSRSPSVPHPRLASDG